MRIVLFSAKPYDRESFEAANDGHGHDLTYLDTRLDLRTSPLAEGHQAVCAFVNDDLSGPVVDDLADRGVRLLLLRSAGYNHVDLAAAEARGLVVARVPAYSPYAVAEHAAGLLLALNRHLHRAWIRVREQNFGLHGLMGMDLHGKTVGVIGTGQIGTVFTRIMAGFGVRLLAHDPYPNDECRALGAEYVDVGHLAAHSHAVALHCPLTPDTHHLVDADFLDRMPRGALLVNTSRGGLVDTPAVIDALRAGHLGGLAIDVYEEEAGLFFEDRSEEILTDDAFARLLTFPNVIVTAHQAFFTREAVQRIAGTTLANATAFVTGRGDLQRVTP